VWCGGFDSWCRAHRRAGGVPPVANRSFAGKESIMAMETMAKETMAMETMAMDGALSCDRRASSARSCHATETLLSASTLLGSFDHVTEKQRLLYIFLRPLLIMSGEVYPAHRHGNPHWISLVTCSLPWRHALLLGMSPWCHLPLVQSMAWLKLNTCHGWPR
jgi:hypothetical protein